MKIEGSASGSGSISQRHGSADPDPDPHQNVIDLPHCFSEFPILRSWYLLSLFFGQEKETYLAFSMNEKKINLFEGEVERLKKEAAGREEAGLSLASTLKSLTEANQAWEADSRHVRSSRLYIVFVHLLQYLLYKKFPWRLN